MGRSAGKSWLAKAGMIAMLPPFLALSACANKEDAMDKKLATAEAAAAKAVAAQHAAEKAAEIAASIRPSASEPTVTSDEDSDLRPDIDLNGDDSSPDSGNQVSMGGENQTVTPDGTVVPGRGV